MPARRDIMTGRLNFLERPWGGIEPFDYTLPVALREKNVYTHIESDHFHYLELGGENYFSHFTSWKFHRGAEWDTINWGPDKTGIPSPKMPENHCGQFHEHYNCTREAYAGNKDNYSTPRTLASSAAWLEKHHDSDNFLLWAEGFDPHEPFDVPQEFIDLYSPDEMANRDFYWPHYKEAGFYTKEQVKNFRLLYKALLSMADAYVGKILDVFDKYDLWKDTMLILTTDHGFMLGEHGFMAKNYMPDYNEITHIPLIVAAPGLDHGRCNALTQTIDIFPTITSYFGVDSSIFKNTIHGKNLLPVFYKECAEVRDSLIYGYFGKTVNVTDGKYTYLRKTPSPDNEPLYIYGANMSTVQSFFGFDCMDPADFSKIEMGRYLRWTEYPVYKISGKLVTSDGPAIFMTTPPLYMENSMLFDLEADYHQEHPIHDDKLEAFYIEKLKQCMEEAETPLEQYERLGLS